MNALTRHPHAQGVSYLEHWAFAMGIAWRLLSSVFAFALHAVLPCISIRRRFDLEATSAFLLERNRFIENAARTGRAHDTPALAFRQPIQEN
jgi:hypothetical protein